MPGGSDVLPERTDPVSAGDRLFGNRILHRVRDAADGLPGGSDPVSEHSDCLSGCGRRHGDGVPEGCDVMSGNADRVPGKPDDLPDTADGLPNRSYKVSGAEPDGLSGCEYVLPAGGDVLPCCAHAMRTGADGVPPGTDCLSGDSDRVSGSERHRHDGMSDRANAVPEGGYNLPAGLDVLPDAAYVLPVRANDLRRPHRGSDAVLPGTDCLSVYFDEMSGDCYGVSASADPLPGDAHGLPGFRSGCDAVPDSGNRLSEHSYGVPGAAVNSLPGGTDGLHGKPDHDLPIGSDTLPDDSDLVPVESDNLSDYAHDLYAGGGADGMPGSGRKCDGLSVHPDGMPGRNVLHGMPREPYGVPDGEYGVPGAADELPDGADTVSLRCSGPGHVLPQYGGAHGMPG